MKIYKVEYTTSGSSYEIAYLDNLESAKLLMKEYVKFEIEGKYLKESEIDIEEHDSGQMITTIVRKKDSENGYIFSVEISLIVVHNNIVSALG